MNHAYVKMTNVLNADDARKQALRKVILDNGKLFKEFDKIIGADLCKMSAKECVTAVDDFVKRKNIKIVSEKPMVRLDTERNWYRVDVVYTIEV